MEGTLTMKLLNYLTDFGKGFIVGFLLSAIIFGFVAGYMAHRVKVKEVIDYAERQIEIQELREDYINRDPAEFLEVPGVRRAVDGAAADFDRNLDEILQRFRNRTFD
jgi:hypothetical protein